jgi:ParB-like chromosome segregation protein Spo0J
MSDLKPNNTKTMKIKLKNIKKNPYRDLNKYPIDQEKVKKLEKSIEDTDFWDNLLARNINDNIELAYGHHRLEALKNIHGNDFVIDVTVKNINDETMFKIMVNENDSWYDSVSNIDEAAEQAIKFLSIKYNKKEEKVTAENLQDFLGWLHGKAKDALTRINAVKNEKISRDVLSSFKNPSVATRFLNSINGAKKEHIKTIAKEVINKDLSLNDIAKYTKDRVYDFKQPAVKTEKKEAEVSQKIEIIKAEFIEATATANKFKKFLQLTDLPDVKILESAGKAIYEMKRLKNEIINIEKITNKNTLNK